MLVDHAVGQPHQRQAHQRDHRVQGQHRAQHLGELQHQHADGAGQAGQATGDGDALHLAKA